MNKQHVLTGVFCGFLLTLYACGGSGGSNDPDPTPTPTGFSVGGTISGNTNGVALSLNGSAQSFTGGVFAFTTELADGASYDVQFVSAGANESCTVTNGTGTIAAADITNINVVCTQISAMSMLQYSNTAIIGALASGDFNGDSHTDLGFLMRTLDGHPLGANLELVRFAFGNDAGSFASVFDRLSDCSVSAKRGYTMMAADFNGDGFDDLVCSGGDDTGIEVFSGANEPASIFTSGFFQTGLNYFRALDFNADGLSDIFDLGNGQGSPVVTPNFEYFINDGADDFGTIQSFAILNDIGVSLGQSYKAGQFVVGDANGDLVDDLITMNGVVSSIPLNEPLRIAVFTGIASGGFTLPTSASLVAGIDPAFPFNDEFRDLAAGDFNGDGNLDLAISHGAEFVQILLGDGMGGFTDNGPITVGRVPVHIAAADFNGDGNLDLATLNQDTHSLHISFGNGDGTFGSVSAGVGTYISIPLDNEVNLYDMVVADFDGDALPDIAFAESAVRIPGPTNGNGSVQIFLNPGQ